MMTFACITPDGRPIRIDNEHADGAGMPANTGNWMVQYTDNSKGELVDLMVGDYMIVVHQGGCFISCSRKNDIQGILSADS